MERGCAIGHTLSLEVMSQFYATHLGRVRKRARPTFGAGTLLKSTNLWLGKVLDRSNTNYV